MTFQALLARIKRPAGNPTAATATSARANESHRPIAALSTSELFGDITAEVGRLARTHIELVVGEVRADLRAEARAAGWLGVAAVAGLVAINLLLVTIVLALAQVMPGWVAALAVAGAVMLASGIAGVMGWGKRIRVPLHRTRHELEEDVRWAKEKMASNDNKTA